MRSLKNILIELIILSILVCILLFPIHYIVSGEDIDISKKHTSPMFIGSIVLVASLHLIFEVAGINESWCRNEYF